MAESGEAMSFAELLVEALAARDARSLWHADLPWHRQAEVMHQGTRWHAAGLITSAVQREVARRASDLIYPDGRAVVDVRAWNASDGLTAFVEYRDEATTWKGQRIQGAGAMVVEFDDGAIRSLRHFTNTAQLQDAETGWHELLSIYDLLQLPGYHTIGLPTEDWRPYPPAATASRRDTPDFQLTPSSTLAQRVEKNYDPRKFFKDILPEDHYEAAEGGYTEFSGTKWFLAGRMPLQPPTEISDVQSANPIAAIFKMESFNFTHTKTWDTPEGNWAVMEWVSEAKLSDDRDFRNHGLTLLHFDEEGRKAEHREYTNVTYLETMHGDIRPLLSEAAFSSLPCSETWDLPSSEWQPHPIPEEPARKEHRSHVRSTR